MVILWKFEVSLGSKQSLSFYLERFVVDSVGEIKLSDCLARSLGKHVYVAPHVGHVHTETKIKQISKTQKVQLLAFIQLQMPSFTGRQNYWFAE